MYTIAHVENVYSEKFGVPRQSGLVNEVESRIVFEPEFRVPEALRGREKFSHLWLSWVFDRAERRGRDDSLQSADIPESTRSESGLPGEEKCDWRPTVRPPRLGGNARMGVFATRSPFRPNPIGLSCVELERIENDAKDGPVIIVRGADLMNGTPILDIKPYIPYADCKGEATGGFTDETTFNTVDVHIPDELVRKLGGEEAEKLKAVLGQDPRPAYQREQERAYTFRFSRYDVSFLAENGALKVTSVRLVK